MSQDEEYTALLDDLNFAINLPPNRYLNTISYSYDKKTLLSPFVRRIVGDDRNIAFQFLQEIIRRAKDFLEQGYPIERQKLLRDKLDNLPRTIKHLCDFYGEENPDIRSRLHTLRDELNMFMRKPLIE